MTTQYIINTQTITKSGIVHRRLSLDLFSHELAGLAPIQNVWPRLGLISNVTTKLILVVQKVDPD